MYITPMPDFNQYLPTVTYTGTEADFLDEKGRSVS